MCGMKCGCVRLRFDHDSKLKTHPHHQTSCRRRKQQLIDLHPELRERLTSQEDDE